SRAKSTPQAVVATYGSRVDILIMILLFVIALLVWRGARNGLILSLWVIGVIAMIGLFKWHVTSVLDLSF
ncbi:MAG: DUF5993 family protein, partial [Mycobacterium sp.]